MGLFNFDKKREKSNINEVMSFYDDCVSDFHKEAEKHGVANKGVILIPELIPFGEKTILEFLKDQTLQMYSGGDAQQYYYLIMSLAFDAGICFASRWHNDFSSLNEYVAQCDCESILGDAKKLVEDSFPIEVMGIHGHLFLRAIFNRWMEMHGPYWSLADPREYTFKAMLAAYQLGVSMLLEKYGY